MSKFITMAVAGAALAMPFASANADIIVNGHFEQPRVTNGGGYIFFKNIPGWTSTLGHGIEIQRNAAGASFDGYQHVELDSYSNSNMIQTVSTIPNVSYVLSVAYSPHPGKPLATNSIQVLFNNVLIGTLAQNGVGLSSTKFQQYFFTVTPATNNSTVEFRATGTSDAFGGYLDDVILEPLR
jgi:hypothetical protein